MDFLQEKRRELHRFLLTPNTMYIYFPLVLSMSFCVCCEECVVMSSKAGIRFKENILWSKFYEPTVFGSLEKETHLHLFSHTPPVIYDKPVI